MTKVSAWQVKTGNGNWELSMLHYNMREGKWIVLLFSLIASRQQAKRAHKDMQSQTYTYNGAQIAD